MVSPPNRQSWPESYSPHRIRLRQKEEKNSSFHWQHDVPCRDVSSPPIRKQFGVGVTRFHRYLSVVLQALGGFTFVRWLQNPTVVRFFFFC
jgi:hypothetical protein